MQARRDGYASQGEWRADCAGCLVHADGGRLQMGAWSDAAEDVVVDLAVDAADQLIASRQNITFGALDRRLLPRLEAAMAAKEYCVIWKSPCGLYQPSQSSDHEPRPSPSPLADGLLMRTLRDGDAPLVDARWTYRSETSLEERVRPMIRAGLGCVGVEEAGVLQAWILRYQDGPLGMLWVEPHARRRGFGRRLVAQARRELEAASRPCFAFIVDGNTASEQLFAGEGWERVDDADWVGFGPAAP